MVPPPRIIRFDEPFDHVPGEPAGRILRNHEPPAPIEDAPFKLEGVLRGGQAFMAAEACEIPLKPFEADFPLPKDGEHAPPPPLDEASIRAELDAEWRMRMEDTVLTVREEAYDAGYATAKRELEAIVHEQAKDIAMQAEALRVAMTRHLESLEHTAVELSMATASALLEAPLSDSARRASERALAHAAETLAGDGSLEINLHPIDLLKVQESGLQDQLKSAFPELRWTPDDAMAEGDWSARSPKAVIRRIRHEMLELIAEQFGVSKSEAT